MSEGEVFPVPEAWASRALMTAEGYAAALARVESDPDAYWMELAGRLDWNHRDPFDRMLAAQAMIESLVIITGDPAFAGCPGVPTLW